MSTQPDARAARRARRRATSDGDPHHMSELFRWYLGGLIATAREFSLLFAPNPNSYKRFQPGSWAPTGIGWAVDNRTLGFRVVGHGNGMRVESRIPGADANCYHAFAATIAGGLYGIEQQIDPPPPYAGNGYTATDLERIPWNYPEAIELWRSEHNRQAVLRRRRASPRAEPRRSGVAGVQPDRHRLGAPPLLRADLTRRRSVHASAHVRVRESSAPSSATKCAVVSSSRWGRELTTIRIDHRKLGCTDDRSRRP